MAFKILFFPCFIRTRHSVSDTPLKFNYISTNYKKCRVAHSSERDFPKTKKGKSDLHNLSGFPVDKTIVRDTIHREVGAGPDRPVGAPR